MDSQENYVSSRFGTDYVDPQLREHYSHRIDQREPSLREETVKMATSTGRFDDTSYQDYPKHRPFIHDDYRRDVHKPLTAYPESNRQNVMSALRGLQEKIRNLELERSSAEENLKSLAGETSRCMGTLKESRAPEPIESGTSEDERDDYPRSMNGTTLGNTTSGTDVHGKLDAVEHRCELLEKQLDYMRKVVKNAETDRSDAIRRTARFEQDNDSMQDRDIKSKLDKIQDLERENLKLTATQTLVENKIRELDQKLREEKHMRKMMQERDAEGKTIAETDRILMDVVRQRRPKKTKKKQKTKSQKEKQPRSFSANGIKKKTTNNNKSGKEPPEHYRLNLAEIPFIAGKSTGPSHSLAANFQNVLSMMKAHNPRLCRSPRSHLRSGYKYLSPQRHTATPGSSEITASSDSELDDLMLQLQDEFGHMSFEHEELNKQIQDAMDPRLREDLERELDHLVARMEAKGEQIARLRRHQELARSKRAKKVKRRPRSASPAIETLRNHEDIEVVTTIRAQGKKMGSVVINSPNSNKAQASLNLYKDLKKIQSTLQKDDLCWE